MKPDVLITMRYGGVREAGASRRSHALRSALLVAALLGVAVSQAGCTVNTAEPNPPASMLQIAVTVFDRETVLQTPSDTTLLVIDLERKKPGVGQSEVDSIQGTDANTLVCEGVVMQYSGGTTYVDEHREIPAGYAGSVPSQNGEYTCTYSWNQGAQHATITIPVLMPNLPRIQSPASRATLNVPAPGDSAFTLTYANAGNSGASVVAKASDYDRRTASSGPGADNGTAAIESQRFPSAFSVGWGMLSLTRSMTGADITTVGTDSAFESVKIVMYEQVDQVPVFWV